MTDNGPSFTSNDLKLFSAKNGIKHITTAPYHPSSNGQATSRMGSTDFFKTAMKKIVIMNH